MRSHVLLLAFVAACGDGKTAKHFCQNARIMFREMAGGDLDTARRGLRDVGTCADVNMASAKLSRMVTTFKAASVPFRERSEVAATLDALEKLTLDELNQIRCSDLERPTADEVATLRTRIDAVDKKLAEIAAACPDH